MHLSRRAVIGGVAGLGGLGALWTLMPFAGTGDPGAGENGVAAPPAPGRAAGTRLLLLGTQGGPNFNPTRGETASAVLVDGQTYLVDCGYGTLGALIRAEVNHREIARVFLTHLHDDHTADLPALLVRQWTNGRVEPTVVFGPHGTRRMVEAVLAFGEANTTIRLIDEARSVRPSDLFSGTDLDATPAPVEVYRDERVTVRAVENTHYPEESKSQMPYRALSYRFDTGDRSIVFSGDTGYSTGLVELARGADVLVCEVIEVVAMRQAFDGMVARGMYADNPEGIWRHIVDTHTPVEAAGRMAAEAGVGTLVLNHLVPGALGTLPDETYVGVARKAFQGAIVVGRDLMVL
jgi:ribonuclease BN (tRNA processing enzyme)